MDNLLESGYLRKILLLGMDCQAVKEQLLIDCVASRNELAGTIKFILPYIFAKYYANTLFLPYRID